MPFGTPQGPTQSKWQVAANSVAGINGYPVEFSVTAAADNPDDPDMAGIVQQFIDLIASSPNFKVTSASRSYGYQQPITPTT
ncbi:hypothetical protein [Streptomyces sp. NPDC020996]|uniref:hypothetical protein n=1 Tax=Streptomyces sp. NPDC020996 TaxID=3154791 RepID=UPI0033E7A642